MEQQGTRNARLPAFEIQQILIKRELKWIGSRRIITKESTQFSRIDHLLGRQFTQNYILKGTRSFRKTQLLHPLRISHRKLGPLP